MGETGEAGELVHQEAEDGTNTNIATRTVCKVPNYRCLECEPDMVKATVAAPCKNVRQGQFREGERQ